MNIASLFAMLGLSVLWGTHAASQAAPALPLQTGTPPPVFSGMVWRKQGEWHVNGSSATIRLGEAMVPGSLVTAGSGTNQSLTVFMPDGQRLLCECFEARMCAQGFRIPELIHAPPASIWDMFVAVRNTLLLRPVSDVSPFPTPTRRAEMAPRVEIVAPLDVDGKVSIAAALREIPPGRYLLTAMRYGKTAPAAAPQPLQWKKVADQAMVMLEGPGAYHVQLIDAHQVLRVDIELLASPASSSEAEAAALQRTRKTVLQWSATQPGWSLHDFLRVYLESRAAAVAQ